MCNNCNQNNCTDCTQETNICNQCQPAKREYKRKEKLTGIYKITSPTGRVYIGQAVDLKRRITEYNNSDRVKRQHKLKNSFDKYGREAHIIEIIEECLITDLNKRERYWQDFYNVIVEGLNCVLTQTDALPRVISEETRQLLREANIGKKVSPEQIEKFRETRKKSDNNKKGDHHTAIIVLDTESGIFYDCMVDAAYYNNINYSTLRNMLNTNNRYKNKTNLIKV